MVGIQLTICQMSEREVKVLDGEPIGDGDKLNVYQQFTVAKGYSHIWNGNPFCI